MPAKANARSPRQSMPVVQRHDLAGQHRQRRRAAGQSLRAAAPAPSAGPIASTRSARASPAATGSRSGPAGITRPLPKPKPASTTTIDEVLGEARVLQAVVEQQHLRPGRDRGPRRRRRGRAPIQTGAKAASSSGSSPTSAARMPPPARPAPAPRAARRARARRTCAATAPRRQPLGQRDHRRRLAGPAGGQVADADHRHPRPAPPAPAPAAGGWRAVQSPGERRQQRARASPGRAGGFGPEAAARCISARRSR